MVGLDKFREAFKDFSDNYVIIGGTACDIAMTGTTVRPRATHDIDMIVIIENMTPMFGQKFWDFVKEAGYRPERHQATENEPLKYEMYRFVGGKAGYPEMIELLSRHPDILGNPKGLVIEPLPISDYVSSLSAIIMDDDLYHFTISNSMVTDGIRHASPIALIALKAKAYLNLTNDKAIGKHVNTKDIKKHRSDVLKNVFIASGDAVSAPKSISTCIHQFVASIRSDFDTLSTPLSKALDIDKSLLNPLLEQLDNLFPQVDSSNDIYTVRH